MRNVVADNLKLSEGETKLLFRVGFPKDMVRFWSHMEIPYLIPEGNFHSIYDSGLTGDWVRVVSASSGGNMPLERKANLPDGFLRFFSSDSVAEMNPIYLNRLLSVTSIPFGGRF